VLVITQKQEREPDKTAGKSMRAADILAQRLPQVPDKPAGTESETGTPAPKPVTSPSAAIQPKPAAPVGTGTVQAIAHPGTAGSVPLTNKPAQAKVPPSGTSASTPLQPRTAPIGTAPTKTPVSKPTSTPAQTAPSTDTGDTPQ